MSRARCWLCARGGTEDVVQFHSFAVRYAPTVDSLSMATSFHNTLRERVAPVPHRERETGRGYQRDTVAARPCECGRDENPQGSDDESVDSDPWSDAEEQADGEDKELDDIPSIEEINTHLSLHVLHPTVRVAHALRGLVEMGETLRDLAVTKGGEGENPLVDVRTVAMYLKVTSEIMQIYRSADPTKMLFGGTEGR